MPQCHSSAMYSVHPEEDNSKVSNFKTVKHSCEKRRYKKISYRWQTARRVYRSPNMVPFDMLSFVMYGFLLVFYSNFWSQKKLEGWGYRSEKEVWRCLQPFGYNTPAWQTDRQTDNGDSKDRYAWRCTVNTRHLKIRYFYSISHFFVQYGIT